jgi:hypothetical protein
MMGKQWQIVNQNIVANANSRFLCRSRHIIPMSARIRVQLRRNLANIVLFGEVYLLVLW